jgi:DNA-binding MarR family transcriptional regulator
VDARSKEADATRPAASLAEIARTLDEAAQSLREHAEREAAAAAAFTTGDDRPVTAAQVRGLLAVRRVRARTFAIGGDDAAWTMMLELYAARLEGRQVNQRRLGRSAGVSPTTALRLVRALAAEGLLAVARDPNNRRNLTITLTDDAAAKMAEYLAATLGAAALL